MSRKSRRSAPIRVLTSADRTLLLALGHVGTVTSHQAHLFARVNPDRLQRLARSRFLSLDSFLLNGIPLYSVTLADRGRRFVLDSLNLPYLYRTNPRQILHDIKLASAYFSFPPPVRATWQNEAMLWNRFGKVIKAINPNHDGFLDAVVSIDGKNIAIEAIGSGYTRKLLNTKTAYAFRFFDGIRFVN